MQRLADHTAVKTAVDSTRLAVDKLLAHRFLRTDAAAATVALAERAALAGADLDGLTAGPAMTVHAETAALATTWETAPAQTLARLHVLAADPGDPDVGRPRPDADSARLDLLLDAVVATKAPAVVVAGVVHAELLALAPFGTRDALVARGAARAVLVSSGYDPRVLLAFEAGYDPDSYAAALKSYESGDPVGWLVRWCAAIDEATRVGISVCDELRAARG